MIAVEVPIHDDGRFSLFVIPGSTRNPVFFWIPAFAGMTPFVGINVALEIGPSLIFQIDSSQIITEYFMGTAAVK